MTHQFNFADSIEYLGQFLTFNKARGMMAEIALDTDLRSTASATPDKIFAGGWLLSPKIEHSSRYRYCIFVLPHLYASDSELDQDISELQRNRGWQSLAVFLSQTGIGVIVSAALPQGAAIHPAALRWRNFIYQGEKLQAVLGDEPYAKWPGSRGRASSGNPWQSDIVLRFGQVSPDQLTALTLRQAFFYGYLKQTLKKPLDDPYDVDAFVVGYRGSILPVEVKEKSPTPDGNFGIDAGRILMLLRLCLATDSNALYLIRQVDSSSERRFVRWRAITLSDMIIGCSWNLQAGGLGMGGGATQTVMMPNSLFEDFDPANISEEWILEHNSLQTSARFVATKLAEDLSRFL